MVSIGRSCQNIARAPPAPQVESALLAANRLNQGAAQRDPGGEPTENKTRHRNRREQQREQLGVRQRPRAQAM